MKRAKVACLCLCSGECFNIQFVGKLKKKCSMHFRLLLVLRLWTNAARAVYLKAFCIPLIFQVFFPASLADYLRPFHFLFSYRSHLKNMECAQKHDQIGQAFLDFITLKSCCCYRFLNLTFRRRPKKPSLFSQSNKSLCFVQKLAKTIPLLLTQFVVHFSWLFFTDYSVPFWPGKKVLQVRK